ncbi:MAG TPA: alpha/beta fold hydrolase [Bryobacteraceae bacterium]
MRLFALPVAGLLLAALAPAQLPQAQAAGIARHALNLLLQQDFTALRGTFDQTMKQGLTKQMFDAKVVPQLQALGTAEKIGQPQVYKRGPNDVAVFPIQFAKGHFQIILTINPQGEIAGLFLRPGQPATSAKWKPPPYDDPARFHSLAVTVGQTWRLPGTLLTPVGQGPFPGVVLVQGSGPGDRDETIGPNKPFRDLAEGLASKGIAVLRYDKRTLVYRQEMMSMHDVTVEQETIQDAINAVRLLQHQPKVKARRVFLLGHSLGGYLAPRIAKQDPGIAGLIILAGNARPVTQLVLMQEKELGAPPQQIAQIEKDIAKIHALKPGQQSSKLIFHAPPSYWLDLRNYHPTAVAKSLRIPMLLLQGGRDYQVTKTDFDLWKSALAGKPKVTFHLFPDLNHLFMPGEGKSTPAEYYKPGHVSVNVIEQIASWIKAEAG